VLVIEHLTKVYPGGVQALQDINLTIDDGEFVVIIGLSGSGKSTLLRCINRLVEPTEGKISWNGADVTGADAEELRAIRRQIGMVFQQFNLVRRVSVLTNAGRLGYLPPSASLLNYFAKAERERAMRCLERVGIADKAHARADQLSGGQQQRVGIARALMQEPRLVLADEPVASLDPATSHSVLKYLEQLNKEEGITILCSLHFLSLARRYATRIVALKAGQLVFDGLPAEIDEARFREIYGEDAIQVEVA